MEVALGTASWLVGKVVDLLSAELLKALEDSYSLGGNARTIKMELLYTQGLLHKAQGRNVSHNPALAELLLQLGQLADEADNELDEVDYYRIRDAVEHTQEAASDEDVDGLVRRLTLHARHALGKCRRSLMSSCSSCCPQRHLHGRRPNTSNGASNGSDHEEFNRSVTSDRMKSLVAQMQPLCAKISTFLKLELMDPKHSSPARGTAAAFSERVTTTTSTSLEAKLYGRDAIFKATVAEMTSGRYHRDSLSVLPIVGPGGIGKTTFTQHLFNDTKVKTHFNIRIWVHVSLGFDVLRLTKEIFKSILASEKSKRTRNAREPHSLDQLQKSVEERLRSKRFLLILDDMWRCDSEDKWEKLLAPFRKTMVKGCMVLVTTRSSATAEMVKSETAKLVNLEGLEPQEFWEFFLACAFGDDHKAEHHKDLLDIGREIVKKLKWSPLAAKTVGRLLKKDLTRQHWSRVLDSKEWERENGVNDIMPALKLSYDCLPFHLQKCFSYCALFPYDYRYVSSELTHMWSALGVINCSGQDNRIEDIGLQYINGLVNNGIFQKVDGFKFSRKNGAEIKYTYYVMHNLFHELAQIISSRECLSIDCSNFRLAYTPRSVRHLSVMTRCTNDVGIDFSQKFVEEMNNLKEQLSIKNLHTLMFIGEYDARFSDAFNEIVKEIKHVRVLRLFETTLEFVPTQLIHLRYLRIQASKETVSAQLRCNRSNAQLRWYRFRQLVIGETSARNDSLTLPRSLSRYYHLRFLDLQDWSGMSAVPENMSHLIHLRQFLASKELHSSVAEVGKLKFLQELRKFQVNKEHRAGFELRQLGELNDLGGSLTISDLQNVETRTEAEKAKLKLKRNLVRLKLVWDNGEPSQPTMEADVIEGLQPHANLRELCIKNHRGITCPTWFNGTITLKMLEVLHLHTVSWDTLPPFGQIPYLRKLKLENIAMQQFEATGESLENLRTIEFLHMQSLEKWVSRDTSRFFSQLEEVKVSHCPNLRELPFSQQPQLSQTHTAQTWHFFHPALLLIWLALRVIGLMRPFRALPLQDTRVRMPNLRKLLVRDCPLLSLPLLPYTPTLESVEVARQQYNLLYYGYRLEIKRMNNVISAFGNLDNVLAFHNMGGLVRLTITACSSVPLTALQKLTSLEKLAIEDCSSLSSSQGGESNGAIQIPIKTLVLRNCLITGKELSELLACLPCLSYLELHSCQGITGLCMKQRVASEHDDGTTDGMVQFPPQFSNSLSRLHIFSLHNRTLHAKDGVLGKLTSLQWLQLGGCVLSPPRQQSHESTTTMAVDDDDDDLPLRNNLKGLGVYNHGSIQSYTDGLAEGHFSKVARTVVAGSFQLEELEIGSISAILVAGICSHLSISLRKLTFRNDRQVERFTDEQGDALQLLTLLRELVFYWCDNLQSLPPRLRLLPSLMRLEVSSRQLQGHSPQLREQCNDLKRDIQEVVLS